MRCHRSRKLRFAASVTGPHMVFKSGIKYAISYCVKLGILHGIKYGIFTWHQMWCFTWHQIFYFIRYLIWHPTWHFCLASKMVFNMEFHLDEGIMGDFKLCERVTFKVLLWVAVRHRISNPMSILALLLHQTPLNLINSSIWNLKKIW